MSEGSPRPDDGIRVGTAERENAADLLNEAFEQGRLSLSEHGERLSACFVAVTRADLRALVADLPGGEALEFDSPTDAQAAGNEGQRGAAMTTSREVSRRSPPEKTSTEMLRSIWVPWAGVSALVTMIWLLTALTGGEAYYFWPIWVMGPWGAVNFVATLGIWSKRDE